MPLPLQHLSTKVSFFWSFPWFHTLWFWNVSSCVTTIRKLNGTYVLIQKDSKSALCRSYLIIRSFLIAWGLQSTTKADRKDGWRDGTCLHIMKAHMMFFLFIVEHPMWDNRITFTYLYTMGIQSLRLDSWRVLTQTYWRCRSWFPKFWSLKRDERNAQEICVLGLGIDHLGPEDWFRYDSYTFWFRYI